MWDCILWSDNDYKGSLTMNRQPGENLSNLLVSSKTCWISTKRLIMKKVWITSKFAKNGVQFVKEKSSVNRHKRPIFYMANPD